MNCTDKTRIVFGVLLLGLSLTATVTAQAQARPNAQRQQWQQQPRRLPEHFVQSYRVQQNEYRGEQLSRLQQSFAGVRRDSYGREGLRFTDEWRAPIYNNWERNPRFLPDVIGARFIRRPRWAPPEDWRYIGGYYVGGVAVSFSVGAAYEGIVVGPNFVPAYWRYRPWNRVWCDPSGNCSNEAPVLAETDVVLVEVPQTFVVDDGYGNYVTRKVVSLETATYEPEFSASWGYGAFVFNDYFGHQRGFIDYHVRIRR